MLAGAGSYQKWWVVHYNDIDSFLLLLLPFAKLAIKRLKHPLMISVIEIYRHLDLNDHLTSCPNPWHSITVINSKIFWTVTMIHRKKTIAKSVAANADIMYGSWTWPETGYFERILAWKYLDFHEKQQQRPNKKLWFKNSESHQLKIKTKTNKPISFMWRKSVINHLITIKQFQRVFLFLLRR